MADDRVGIALEYSDDVPRVLSIARGLLFETMMELARKHGITVYEDPDLAQVLSHLPPGSEIPETLFAAVAEVLAYCYRVNAGFKAKLDHRELV